MSTERREDELLPPPAEPPAENWEPDPRPDWGNQGGIPGYGSSQPMRQLDSEDGPPPRRGGPTG
jgi:hypothetical protein